MRQLEINMRESFNLAKTDIFKLQSDMAELRKGQQMIMNLLSRIKAGPKTSSRKTYVASVTGKKVHESNCPFAKNIKPKNRLMYRKKSVALNTGYKACECMKRM